MTSKVVARHGRRYTVESLLAERDRFVQENGRAPTSSDWKYGGEWPDPQSATSRFGSWHKFMIAGTPVPLLERQRAAAVVARQGKNAAEEESRKRNKQIKLALPNEVHDALVAESKRTGETMVSLTREVLLEWARNQNVRMGWRNRSRRNGKGEK